MVKFHNPFSIFVNRSPHKKGEMFGGLMKEEVYLRC
jgi:hypothetical protein